MGDKHHPLPWSVLKYSTEMDGPVVNIDKETLNSVPTFNSGENPKREDEGWGKTHHNHDNATAYWI